jgi:hypothetical protein
MAFSLWSRQSLLEVPGYALVSSRKVQQVENLKAFHHSFASLTSEHKEKKR